MYYCNEIAETQCVLHLLVNYQGFHIFKIDVYFFISLGSKKCSCLQE